MLKEHELSVKSFLPLTGETGRVLTEADLSVQGQPTSLIAEKVAEYCETQPAAQSISNEPKPIQKISDLDRLALDLAKERKLVAEARLQTAQSQLQTADISFRYVILQLYHKYQLQMSDALNEDGSIIYAPKEVK